MSKKRRTTQIATFVAAVLMLALSAAQFSAAQEGSKVLSIVSQLKGTWTIALSGVTGCGTTTLQSTFTLDANGNGTQSSATEHTAACGDIDLSGQSAQIQQFNADGTGFLALGCGSGCGFGFNIQAS